MERKIPLSFAILIISLLLQISIKMSAQQNQISQHLPSNVDAWSNVGNDKEYNEDNLYEHINGGAELFISYGFIKTISRTYSKGGEAEISVDIYNMIEPKNAFGIFSHSRESIDYTYGQGCQIYEDAVLFWKDRYYVAISCFKCIDNTQDVLLEMARYISSSIDSEGSLPEILSKLPRNKLLEESILYFNHHAWQNAFYYLGDDNFLFITKETDVVLAKYGEAGNLQYLMMIQYIDDQKASLAMENFRKDYLEDSDKQIMLLEDGFWLGTAKKDSFVMLVFHGNSKEQVIDLLNSVQETL